MTEVETLAERIEKLEIRCAYQDQALEDLATTITDQFRTISELRTRVAHLEAQAMAPEPPISSIVASEAPSSHI